MLTNFIIYFFFKKCMEYKYNFNVIASTADFMFDFYILRFSNLSVKKPVITYMKIQNNQK